MSNLRTRNVSRRNMKPACLLLFTASVIVSSLGSSAAGQETETPTVNYAFATQLGSGIYTVSGRTVQIYRLTISIPLVKPEEHEWGLRLKIPTTFGFFDFRIEDIVDTGLPDNISTLAVVPELELELPRPRENWRVLPFVGFGVGKDFRGGESSVIYAGGVRSLVIWPWGIREVRLGNRLIYSGYTTGHMDFVDDFGAFETGVDVRRPLGFDFLEREVDGSVFAANYLYLVSPRLVSLNTDFLDFRTEWEFGFTIGTAEPWRVLKIGMPRIGLSYRFDTERGAVRFVIGDAFPIAAPDEQSAEIR